MADNSDVDNGTHRAIKPAYIVDDAKVSECAGWRVWKRVDE
jgi:hypothetical protein